MRRNQGSPDRNRSSGNLNNRFSPAKKPASTKDRYLKAGSPTKMTQEQQFTEAKRILDMHINYLSRGCYYYFRDAIARYETEALNVLRDYRHHESSDQLVNAMTEYFNSKEATPKSRAARDSQSPIRTTSANVASQDRVRASMKRERGTVSNADLQTDFNGNRKTPQPVQKRSFADLKQILGFSNRYSFEDVS